jgi:hypothetical protein
MFLRRICMLLFRVTVSCRANGGHVFNLLLKIGKYTTDHVNNCKIFHLSATCLKFKVKTANLAEISSKSKLMLKNIQETVRSDYSNQSF